MASPKSRDDQPEISDQNSMPRGTGSTYAKRVQENCKVEVNRKGKQSRWVGRSEAVGMQIGLGFDAGG